MMLSPAGHGVTVKLRHCIQSSEVIKKPETSIWLGYYHYGAGPRAGGLFRDLFLEHLCHVLLSRLATYLQDPGRLLADVCAVWGFYIEMYQVCLHGHGRDYVLKLPELLILHGSEVLFYVGSLSQPGQKSIRCCEGKHRHYPTFPQVYTINL